jgi:hypothetical protein
LTRLVCCPLAHGLQIHERDPFLDPIEGQGARRFVAVTGCAKDHAVTGERLVPVFQHEKMLRVVEQSLVIDVSVMTGALQSAG